MVEILNWMNAFLEALDGLFAERIWFVGLQGSYGRGEATENSDLDVVVILNALTSADIRAYNAMLDTLPHREKICGFFSGKQELLNWEPADLFQFYHDTKPIRGSLDDLLPLLDKAAVDRAIKIGLCNIYHGCVHNMLHEKDVEILKSLYKSASFVVQAIAFREMRHYVSCQKDLLSVVSPEDRGIVETFLHLKNGSAIDFEKMSEALFRWAQRSLQYDTLHELKPAAL